MANDFDILIGVDMSNAESEIKKSLDSIADSYPMKIKSIFENKDNVVKEISQIEKLIKNLGKLDTSINIEEDIKKAINSATKLKKTLEDGMKSSQKSTKDNNVELENGNKLLKTQIKLLQDAKGNEKRIVKTTTGTSNDKTTKTSVNGKDEVGYERTINNEKIKSDEKKLQTQLLKQKELFQEQLNEVERKGLAHKNSTNAMQRKINELNVKDVQDLVKVEKQLSKIAKQYEIIKEQAKNKQFSIKKSDALESIEKDKAKIDPNVIKDNKKLANDLNKKAQGVSEADNYEALRVAIKNADKSYDALIAKQEEYVASLKAEKALVKQMADGRENANSKSNNDTKKVETNQSQAINKELERTNMNQMEINKATKQYEQLMKDIKNTGFIDDGDFTKARRLMTGLSTDSKSLAMELKAVKKEIDAVQTKANKQLENQKHVNSAKVENTTDVNKIKDKGIVPQSFIDNFKQLNSMLDFTSDAKDLKIVKEELARILQLEKDIISAGADNLKRNQAIAQATEKVVKSTHAHADAVEKVQHNIGKQITDATRRNNLEEQALRIQAQINEYKVRGTALTNDESRMINQMKLALERELSTQKDIEKTLREEAKLRRTIANEVENATYKASRGLSNNPAEQRRINAMANNLRTQSSDLVNGNQTGDSFTRSAQAIRDSMNAMNNEHRRVSDNMRDRSTSTLGMLGTAMKKIPIWMSAMSLFYGAINQVKKGFQSLLEFDKAMVNLQKVTEASSRELEAFKQTASEIGDTMGVMATQVVTATAEFQKLGYSLNEASLLGKSSILYANVGDMGVEDAQKSIISTVKGFGIEIDKEGKNVTNIVDIFNEVGNNFAITSEGIGEALRRSSAVLKEAGNSIEQSVGLVTAANTTIQDPRRVGTALKTLSMRLRGVSEEGTHIKQLVPDIEKTLEGLNSKLGLSGDEKLTLMKDANTFLTTFEIFDKISGQWENMEDIERANLVELMGGKEQGAIVASMIGNWADATDSYKVALNSAGSAQREFNVYMDSFEFKIGRLKGAMEHFWITLINDEAVKSAIDGLTSLIQVITKLTESPIGGGGTMIAQVIGLIMLFSSKGLRTAMLSAESMRVAFTGAGTAIAGMGKALLGLSRSIPVIGAWMLAIWGVTKSVEFLSKIITFESKQREKKIQLLRDEVQELGNLKGAYDKFDEENQKGSVKGFDRLSDLDSQGERRTPEEELEYSNLLKVVEDTIPDVILYHNEYGEAVLRSSEQIKNLREENEKLSLQQSQSLLRSELEDSDFGKLSKGVEKQKDLMGRQSESSAELEVYSQTRKWIESEIVEMDLTKEEYYEKIEEIKTRANELMKEKGLEPSTNSNGLNGILSKFMKKGDVDEALSSIDFMSDGINGRMKHLTGEIQDSKATITKEMDDFSLKLRTSLENTLKSKGFDIDSSEGKLAQELEEYVENNLADFDRNFMENIDKKFPKILDKAIKKIEAKNISVDDLFTFDAETSTQTAKEIQKVISSLRKDMKDKSSTEEERLELKRYIEVLKEVKNTHIEVVEAMDSERIKPFNYEEDVIPLVKSFEDGIMGLDSAYRTLADGQKLSMSQIFSLISEYPELNKHLTNHNGQLKLSKNALKELAEIQERNFKRDLEIAKQKAISDKESARVAIQSIMGQVKAEKLLEEAKSKGIEYALRDANSIAAAQAMQEMIDKTNANDAFYNDSISALEKLMNADYSANLGSLGNANDKANKESIYITDEYKLAIEKLNHEIAKLQKIKAKFPEHSKKYQDALKSEIKLQKEALNLTNKQAEKLSKQIKSGAIVQTGNISNDNNSNVSKELQGWDGRISSQYGNRTHPISGVYKPHDGMDITGNKGDRLDANVSGKVIFAGNKGNGLGNYVQIQSNDGMKHLYGHLDKIVATLGQSIQAGMQIGNIGSTGSATGPHVHYETRDASGKLVDPNTSYKNTTSGKVASTGGANIDNTQQAIDKAKSELLSLQMDAINTQENIENLEIGLINANLAGYENKKTMNDNQLANSENKLKKLTESSKEYRKELEAQRGILDRKQKHNNEEISYLKGIIGSGKLSAVAVDEFTRKLHELGLEKNALNFEKEELTMKSIQSTMSSFSNTLNDDIAYAEYSMGLYHESSNEYVKFSKVKEGHLLTQLSLHEQELDFLEKEKKTNKSLTASQILDINELIRERRVALYSMLEGIKTLRSEMAKSKPAMYEAQRDALSDDIAYTEYAMGLYDSASEGFRKFATVKEGYLTTQLELHKKELVYLETEKKLNKELNDAQIFELNALIRESRKAVYGVSESLIALKTQIADSKLSAELFTMASETEKYARKIREINDRMKYEGYDSDKEEYAKEIDYLRQIVALRKGEVADIKSNISKLTGMKEANKDNLEMVKKITQELSQWEDKLVDSEGAILDLQKTIKDAYKKMADSIVDIYKEQLELMKKADEDHYKKKMDAEKKAHDSRMSQIDKEIEAVQKSYDIQNQRLNREKSTEDYSKELDKLQDEAKELQKQIAILSLDDSYEAKAKKAKLVKQLTETEMKMAEHQNDRTYELRQNNLDDDLKTDLEMLESKKNAFQAEYDTWVEMQEKKHEEQMKIFDQQLNDERKFAKLREEIMQGNFDSMAEMLGEWSVNVEGKMGELGEIITHNFTDKIADAIKALTDLKNMNIGSFNNTVNNSGLTNLDGDNVYEGSQGGAVEDLADINGMTGDYGETSSTNGTNPNPPNGSGNGSSGSTGGSTAPSKPRPYKIVKVTQTYWLFNSTKMATSTRIGKLEEGKSYKYYLVEKDGMWDLGGGWFPKKYLRLIDSTETVKPVASPKSSVASSSSSSSSASTAKAYTGQYASFINEASKKYGVDPFLIASVIKQESGFNASAKSSAGATGLMQLMPATAKELGVKNSLDPKDNIMGGTKYLAEQLQRFSGNIEKALYAYNAGAGNVNSIMNSSSGQWLQPKDYYNKVTANYKSYTGSSVGSASSPSSSASSSGSSSSGVTKMKTTENLNMRSKPNSNGEVIHVISKGSIIQYNGMEAGWAKVTANGKTGYASRQYLQSFDTGGYTGAFGSEGRVALLHEKELVLNKEQTKDILDTAKIVEKIKAMLPNIGGSIISPRQQASTERESVVNEYNIEVIVENLNGSKKEADRVGEQMVNAIKRNKGGRF